MNWKKSENVKSIYIHLIYKMLCFVIEWLAMAIFIDRSSPSKVLEKTSWIVTEWNLSYFSAKGHRICLEPLNIFKIFFLYYQIQFVWIGEVPLR